MSMKQLKLESFISFWLFILVCMVDYYNNGFQ